MTRGTVVWVDLSDASPPEMGKRGPAVVISNSAQNQILDTVVAVPLSSRPPEIEPLRIRLTIAVSRRPSYAIVPGIRQLKKARILGQAGRASDADLARIDAAVRDYLSD